jgi:thymidylate synthase (FAD)
MKFKILDHGYVEFIEAWGTGKAGRPDPTCNIDGEENPCDYECGIIEAARQSTQASFRGWEEDEKLLSFLFSGKPQHATPFEFAGCVIEVQAPIMVFREWHRHRTQSYNEMSGRYAPLPNLNYLPTSTRILQVNEAGRNKQAGAIKDAPEVYVGDSIEFQGDLKTLYQAEEDFYQKWLNRGVAKELARLPIGVGRYSRMRAQANLRNWLAFMTLRADPAAQWEIQQYAHAVGKILEEKFPKTWGLFNLKRASEVKTPS